MGRMSLTPVEGWHPGFWDGVDKDGKHVGGIAWFEPEVRPFPPQDARRQHRVEQRMTIKDAADACGLSSVDISQWERGVIELTPEQIAAYDAATGYGDE